jgi:Fe-S-cluster-containing dehydrogenase component
MPRFLLNNGNPLGTWPAGKSSKANKCDFCYDRAGNTTLKSSPYKSSCTFDGKIVKSNKPACQVVCPTGAITTGTGGNAAATAKAQERVDYLLANGYPRAGVYPAGWGTHVKWVLLDLPVRYGLNGH